MPDAGGTIRCLGAKKTSEALAVELTEANLAHLFSFLHGSDTSPEKSRHTSQIASIRVLLPKGKSKNMEMMLVMCRKTSLTRVHSQRGEKVLQLHLLYLLHFSFALSGTHVL